MNWYRIRALISRTFKLSFRGIEPYLDYFYWPLLDIVIWGFSTRWLESADKSSGSFSALLLIFLVLSQITYRANLTLALNLLSELWARNIVNLFATPLTMNEWLAALMLLGTFNMLISVSIGAVAVWIFYHINIFMLGWTLLPSAVLLLLSGWAIGLFTSACIIYFGQRAQNLVWVMGWFFMPLSAIYYPLAALPNWAQIPAKFLPMSYVFECLRSYYATNKLSFTYWAQGSLLALFYLAITFYFFTYMFEKSRAAGLARLENE